MLQALTVFSTSPWGTCFLIWGNVEVCRLQQQTKHVDLDWFKLMLRTEMICARYLLCKVITFNIHTTVSLPHPEEVSSIFSVQSIGVTDSMLHQKWLIFKISASVPTLWPDLCFFIWCLMIWTHICVTFFHRRYSIWSVYPLVWSRLEEIPVMIWLSGWCFVGGALVPYLFCSPAIQSARQYLRPAQSCTLRDFISYLMEVTQPRCFVTLCLHHNTA